MLEKNKTPAIEESIKKTPAIDALIEKGGPGSGVKGHTTQKQKSSDIRRHPQYTSSDYSALKKKGYTDKEIKGIWDKDKKSSKDPLHRKEIPKIIESVRKTPAIDALIKKE